MPKAVTTTQAHPYHPLLKDEEAVPLIEAAILAVAAFGQAIVGPYPAPYIYPGHPARKRVLENLYCLLARAKGEDEGCNASLAEVFRWKLVRLSPIEQALIDHARKGSSINLSVHGIPAAAWDAISGQTHEFPPDKDRRAFYNKVVRLDDEGHQTVTAFLDYDEGERRYATAHPTAAPSVEA